MGGNGCGWCGRLDSETGAKLRCSIGNSFGESKITMICGECDHGLAGWSFCVWSSSGFFYVM